MRLQLEASDSSTHYEPITAWFPAIWGNKVNVGYVYGGAMGGSNLEFQYAVQFAATSPEAPGSWGTSIDSWHTHGTSNISTCTGDLSVGNTSDMWMRIGVAYNLSTGSTYATATLESFVASRT